ncbi:late competence development ComFB family protein [Vibrio mangrovi]|uniref:Late competence development ComFB family protein n=1 Tax=Vibrio mangrovi TaxID=474394 RepID=A0A1Y6IVC2_9VIBR|nr:late competence development ComFB family protein [Vibrio mangrovi]MDW6004472.1 late competence development ComFB family protein [Vibrio mangrovi]SMS00760.1 Late competence development protein ComFB [Vibrio mangrovi]
MHISVDVHNYMENLVGQILSSDDFKERYDHEQLADLACLALSQLRPVYIRHDIDFLSALPEERLVKLKQFAKDAVEAGETMIQNDRRRNPEYREIPIVVATARYDDDLELEWYESPILGHHTDHQKEK